LLDEDMSGEAAAGGGGEANGVQPNVTIYINNLNEKIKLEGTAPLL
jgi:U1 small nuclear ribonucleoprotein A